MTNDPSADEPITEEAAEAAARQAEERVRGLLAANLGEPAGGLWRRRRC